MVNLSQHFRIRQAANLVRAGGLIAYPTEAVWGLGCDPANPVAVDTLLALKGRPLVKGMILIAANRQQLTPYLGSLSAEQEARLDAQTSLPTTWVVPASSFAPPWITGGRKTLAVRITRHALAAALCSAFGGPLVSTSANPSGSKPAKTQLKVRQYFGNTALFIVPGPLGGSTRPSEIRDLQTGHIIRQGG